MERSDGPAKTREYTGRSSSGTLAGTFSMGRRRSRASVVVATVIFLLALASQQLVAAITFAQSQLPPLRKIRTALLAANDTAGWRAFDYPTPADNPIDSWNGFNCDNWLGLTCDSEGYITRIVLSPYNITLPSGEQLQATYSAFSAELNYTQYIVGGTLSPALAQLSRLEHLIIIENLLFGSIPEELGAMPSLKVLNLTNNILEGHIPSSLGNISTLEYLGLGGNKDLTNLPGQPDIVAYSLNGTIPATLGNLSNLQYLDLHDLVLTGTPPSSLQKLTNLTYLDLSTNYLSGNFPSFLPISKKLRHVDLHYNDFTGTLDIFSELTELRTLIITDTLASGQLPEAFGNLTNLQHLEVAGSPQVNGTIPDSFQNLKNLNYLNLAANSLGGDLPTAVLGKLPRLTYLGLAQNAFTGLATINFSNPEALTFVDLRSNFLQGELPSFPGCKNLNYLSLDNNNFSGGIPPGLVDLKNLLTFTCDSCGLGGNLPPGIGNSSIQSFYIADNSFYGKIPDDICGANTSDLDLSSNKLTGSIPQSLGNCVFLDTLYLQNNQLIEPLPEALGQTQLSVLDVSNNQLTGALTSLLQLNQSLVYLDVSNNSFSGDIPVEMGQFSSLTELILSHNNFYGPLPKEIGNLAGTRPLTGLLNLRIRGCKLVGTIPSELTQLEFLQYLDLSSNELSGTLPNNIFSNFSYLAGLTLASNGFFGTIPELSQMTSLASLDLSNNEFTGGLNQSFPPNLVSLNLSINYLEGDVTSIQKLKNLSYVDLENNTFSGSIPFINASDVVLLGNNKYTKYPNAVETDYSKRTKYNRTLQFSQTPLCLIGNYSKQAPCQSNVTVPSYKDRPVCTDSASCSGGDNVYNPYLATRGTCNCTGYTVIELRLQNSPTSILLDSSGSTLNQFLATNFTPPSRVFINQSASQPDGSISVQTFLFDSEGPVATAELQKLLSYWPNSGFQMIESLGQAKKPTYRNVSTYVAPPPPPPNVPPPKKKSSNTVPIVAGAVGGALLLICCLLVGILIYFLHFRDKKETEIAKRVREHFVKQLRYREIRAATDNFNVANKLGAGGYGTVYKGVTPAGEIWAVKRAKSNSIKNVNEFENEVDVISKMSHTNIVRLLGFCDEHSEQILVYEFMEGGTLRSRIQRPKEMGDQPLTFPQRVNIAIGVAEGLRYLHNFARPPIIHRDVKSDNILLGGNSEAKLADFGLLKDNSSTTKQLLNTRVAGTPGYIDPEYYSSFQVTTKSDVFSFGVVLLELITGLEPLIKDESITDPDEPNITALANWCVRYLNDYEKLADPALGGEYNNDAMMELTRLAGSCIERCARYRPGMDEVTRRLQKVKNIIDDVPDETINDQPAGIPSSQPAVPSPVDLSGSGSNSESYYGAPVSGRFDGR